MIEYTVVNGTSYPVGTIPCVLSQLEHARKTRTRVYLTFDYEPDKELGCYVGRTTGSVKVPLIIPSSRSCGGDILDAQSIIALRYPTTKHGYLFGYSRHDVDRGNYSPSRLLGRKTG
jgi:hypothetical protein